MEKKSYLRRRRVPRRFFFRPIGLLVDGDYFISRSAEIGEGGIAVFSKRALEIGKMLVVTFKLPDHIPTIVRGIVRYISKDDKTNDYRYGVEFLTLEFAARREIRSYVAARSETEEAC